jgi:hypothetical protein
MTSTPSRPDGEVRGPVRRVPAAHARPLVPLRADLCRLGFCVHPVVRRPDATGAGAVQLDAEPALQRRGDAYGPHDLQRGDYIVFAFAGEARTDYPGLRGQPFFKIVRGLPGDTVTVSGRTVAINGQVVGTAKTHAFDRRPLDPIAPTVIPPGHYYVQGTSADSFDSRYRASGLVRAEQVLGTVVPLF